MAGDRGPTPERSEAAGDTDLPGCLPCPPSPEQVTRVSALPGRASDLFRGMACESHRGSLHGRKSQTDPESTVGQKVSSNS